MPNSMRQVVHDEKWQGELVFLQTGVWLSGRGFRNLKYSIAIARADWLWDGTGTVTVSDQYDATTSRITKRITAGAGSQTGRIRNRLLIPRGAGNANSPTSLSVVTRCSAILPSAMSLTIFQGGVADSTVNGVSVLPSIGATFQTFLFNLGTTYLPGSFITMELDTTLINNGDWGEICDVEFVYASELGNF